VTITATIALAIAGNTVMLGLIGGILLSPLPLPDSGQLVRIEQVQAAGISNVTGATFVDLRARTRLLSGVAAIRTSPATFSADAQALQIAAATVTVDYFPLLRLPAVAGRLPAATDFATGAEQVVFLSRPIFQRVFNGDGRAIGQRVLVNAAPRTVAGVIDVPQSTPGAADVWLPLADSASLLSNRRARLLTVIGRVNAGVTAATASAEMASVAASITREAPQAGADMSLRATPLRDRIVQPVRTSLLLLWAAVGVLTLIAFSNVANLLLMEGSVRERELAVRAAIGAPRIAIIRQLAVEAAAAGAIGGTAGTGLGAAALVMFRSSLPASLPRISDVRVEPWLIAAGIAFSIAASVAFGLVPAFRASRRDAAAALRSRETTSAGSRLRDSLVAAQVALTVMLLFGAALLGRSLLAAARVAMGFDPSGVAAVDVSLPAARYEDSAAHDRFYSAILERLSSIEGIESAAVTGALPLSPTPATTMVAQDGPDDQQPVPDIITATPGFFTTMRIPLRRGRAFTPADRAGAAPVALVNDTAARTMWRAGVDPIGRSIEMRDWDAPYTATVIGIVGDVHQAGGDRDTRAAVYYPLAQFPYGTLTQTVVVRPRAGWAGATAAIRDAVRAVDPNQPLGSTAPMEARISTALAPRLFNLVVLAAFACTALLLAGVGIYGIVAFAMAARAREIGIRVALGAAPRQIVWLAISRGLAPIVTGVGAGSAAAWIAAAAVGGLVYGVGPRDGLSLALAAVLIMCAAAAAIAGPARRALQVDPAISFRQP
jgi:predicted permease